MTRIVEIIRAQREAICAAVLLKLKQSAAYAGVSEASLRWTVETAFLALIDYCERGDEAQARTWAERRAHIASDQGLSVTEMLTGLDLIAVETRALVLAHLTQPPELKATLDHLDACMRFLRRAYTEAHVAAHDSRLSMLHLAAVAMSAELSVENALEGFVRSARSLTRARQAVLVMSQVEGEASRRMVADPPEAADQLGWSSDFLTVFARDPRSFRQEVGTDSGSLKLLPGHPVRRAALVVPVLSQNRLLGALLLLDKEGAEVFSSTDQQMIEILAAHAAVALVNARLYDEVRQQSVSRTLVGQMLQDLQKSAGLSQAAMFQAGQALAERVAANSLPEYLEAFSAMGLGTLVLVGADEAAGRWEFIGDGLVESRTDSGVPACSYARGFLCGAVSRVLGNQRVIAAELRCQAVGDATCQFIVQNPARTSNR